MENNEVKCNVALLKKGDVLSRISYMKVLDTTLSNITVVNESGLEWTISPLVVSKECFSADQAEKEQLVTRTELINLLGQVGEAVCTVNFNKLPIADDFLALTRDSGNKIRSFEDMKKDFKKLKGEDRTIRGYVIKIETGFGRTLVVDLDLSKPNKPEIRQVDHRTLNWLIFKNVKYVVKP